MKAILCDWYTLPYTWISALQAICELFSCMVECVFVRAYMYHVFRNRKCLTPSLIWLSIFSIVLAQFYTHLRASNSTWFSAYIALLYCIWFARSTDPQLSRVWWKRYEEREWGRKPANRYCVIESVFRYVRSQPSGFQVPLFVDRFNSKML